VRIIFCCILIFSLFGCESKPTPEEIFSSYAENLNAAVKLTDVNFSDHLSKRAQMTVAEKMSPALVDIDISLSVNGESVADPKTVVTHTADDESLFEFILEMLKEESALCSNVDSQMTINGKIAHLTCSETEFTDKYGSTSDYTRKVLFVDETMKSTSYDD